MRLSLFLSLILASFSLMAFDRAVPPEHVTYYGNEFFKGSVNKAQLHRILRQKHNSVGYKTARKILFGQLHNEKDGKGQFVEDVYCGKKFYFREVDDVSNMGNTVNIEHTWPQSKFNRRFDKEMQKSDLHHLYPTDSDANNRRGNYHFGNVNEREDELNVHDCDSSRLGYKNGNRVFNPPTEHKGNVARSLFYFATRYEMDIPQEEEKVLREWHLQDPVDEEERERHEAIVKHQGVRNPFVDYPEITDQLRDL